MASPPYVAWKPIYLNQQQGTILLRLCSGRTEFINDPSLVDYIREHGQSMEEFTSDMLDTGLVAMRGREIVLTTESCQVMTLPDGQTVAAENNTGRLTRWVMQRCSK